MRNNDPRSRCIAILPDRLVNAHLATGDDPQSAVLRRSFAMLEHQGFGMIQLPADDLSLGRARASLDFTLDQIADYLKHGYRFLHVELGTEAAAWQPYLDRELLRRAITGIEKIRLDPGGQGLQAFEDKLAAVRREASRLPV